MREISINYTLGCMAEICPSHRHHATIMYAVFASKIEARALEAVPRRGDQTTSRPLSAWSRLRPQTVNGRLVLGIPTEPAMMRSMTSGPFTRHEGNHAAQSADPSACSKGIKVAGALPLGRVESQVISKEPY